MLRAVTIVVSMFILRLSFTLSAVSAAESLTGGFGLADVTPEVGGDAPVWIAGYGQNRPATSVHDPLYARALVVSDGHKRVALVSVDVVGLQYPTVQEIRKRLTGYDYVLVASTHNHEGPDTVGIWGPSPFQTGVNPKYIEHLVKQTVIAIEVANKARAEVTASYGTAVNGELLRDSREPIVKDDILRVVRFNAAGTDKPRCLLVNWSCHPEALASRNQAVTADFPYYAIRDLEAKYNCPVVYFSAAVGGLMAPPRDLYKLPDGASMPDGSFEFSELYGKDVARLAVKAIDAAEPITLTPIRFAAKPIGVPLANRLYRIARAAGVLKREGRKWTGDPENLGEVVARDNPKEIPSGVTEVGYVQMGELNIAAIPGELYPELVYGRCQDPADPGADYPEAPIEPAVVDILPGKKMLLFGLANDELGYIIPKRQWDEKAPFAYGHKDAQYGEGNSCGPELAPILLGSLKRRVAEVTGNKTSP